MPRLNEKQILSGIKRYFAAHEFVGKNTYAKHGERSWKFFDFRLLHTMYILRKNIGKPITINNWFWGGRQRQRGLRTTMEQIVRNAFIRNILYLSAHILGKAVDFDVQGMTAKEVREWIVQNEHLFPYKIRLEKTFGGAEIKWVHLDVIYEEHNPKIYLFAA